MAFTRNSADITSYEAVLYTHWIITIQMLKMGISWEVIQEMNSDEINLILGTEMALKQMENDEQSRSMAASKASSMHKSMGVNF
tara:strand:+ start:530 stop:781 length:252 start_codon:yes stop_codon:yes gene_type:complete